MKKSFYVSLALAAALLFTALPVRADAASRSTTGFPLPTTSTYTASALSHYSGGALHRSYLYTYGAMRNAAYDPYCVVDIPASRGTPIYAVADGTVSVNTYDNGGGNYLVLQHNDGTYSYYGHMRERSTLPLGRAVKAGDVLGYVGMTGTATGYHLHFEWSGHDPYCEYSAQGYITGRTLAAAVYPHQHTSTTGTGITSVSCTVTTGAAETITQTSAVLRGTLSASGVKVTECGVFLGTSRTNMQKLGSDSIDTYSTSFFYSTVKYGRPLTAGTTYYYQAYAKVGNTTYFGEIRTFQTPPAASCTVITGAADTITQTSAVLRGTLSASGVKVTECGMFLGTSRTNMQKLGSDSINTYSTSFFYSTVKYGQALTPGTTYYYQAYAKAGNTTYFGEIRTFQTPPKKSS